MEEREESVDEEAIFANRNEDVKEESGKVKLAVERDERELDGRAVEECERCKEDAADGEACVLSLEGLAADVGELEGLVAPRGPAEGLGADEGRETAGEQRAEPDDHLGMA